MKVTFGISGGIAAYKAASVVSVLIQKGIDVKVVMTKNATKIINPVVFEALTGKSVFLDTFERGDGYVPHIYFSQETDLFIVAPASANILGKAANGIADDVLSTSIIASNKPILFVPSMNSVMYENKAVQKNIETLKEYGHIILEPQEGYLACGATGKGKFPDTKTIVEKIEEILSERKGL